MREAGRELDAEIAENVMGWTDVEWGGAFLWGAFPGLVEAEGEGVTTFVPHYSTEIVHAWLVVEAMRAKGWDCEMQVLTDGFTATFRPYTDYLAPKHRAAVDPRQGGMPLAICLAALQAVSGEIPPNGDAGK